MEEHQPQKKKNPKSQGSKGIKDFGKYSGMAFQMIGIILITTWGGMKLDKLDRNRYTSLYNYSLAAGRVCSNLYCSERFY